MPDPDELLAAVRAAQSAVDRAGDAAYGDVPRRDLPEVVRCADRLAQAVGALDEYQMGGGPPPADWQRAEPAPGQIARYIARHGIPAGTQPDAGRRAEEATMTDARRLLADARQARELLKEALHTNGDLAGLMEHGAEMAERFARLDDHLTAGGRQPGDWERLCAKIPSRADLLAAIRTAANGSDVEQLADHILSELLTAPESEANGPALPGPAVQPSPLTGGAK